MYFYPTFNTYTYNVSNGHVYHYILYISNQIYGQPILLLWHIISKHVYPLELPKMTPFCMKITKKNFWGRTPIPSSITILLATKIYMDMHILNLVVCEKKNMENPVLVRAPVWSLNQHSDPPPSLGFFVLMSVFGFFFFFFFALSKFCCGWKYIVWPWYTLKKFLVELMLKINNLSRQNLPALPLPWNQMFAP